jgi:hypothetical protein
MMNCIRWGFEATSMINRARLNDFAVFCNIIGGAKPNQCLQEDVVRAPGSKGSALVQVK